MARGRMWAAGLFFGLGLAPAWGQAWNSDAALLAAAQKEGSATMYSSNNEEEVLPQLAVFEKATGIKVDYVRATDTALLARIQVENRAGKQSWDVINTPAVHTLPSEWVLVYEPPEGRALFAQAKDADRRWYGTHAILHVPAYNTTKVKESELPKSWADFAKHPEWAGKVAIDFSDRDWLYAMAQHHGEAETKALVRQIVATLRPPLYKGHLALARALGSGEYWLNLTNYANLVLNAKLAGDPVDFWVLDPVTATYGQAGINAKAPHPNAAKLFANFLISAEAQTMRTKWGRFPTRPDVATNPPGIMDRFKDKKLVPAMLTAEQDSRWQKTFNDWFEAK